MRAYPRTRNNAYIKALMDLPAFLKRTGYRNPTNSHDCPFQTGNQTRFHYFEFLENHPEYARQFNAYMSFYHQGRPGWMDFYDVRRLCSNIGPDDVLLVDIGGNVGHDLSEFKRKWPDAPGRLILQDLPKVIKHAKESGLPSYIEPMEHDFFTEQPIKGMYQSPNLASIHRRKRFIVLRRCSCVYSCIPSSMTGQMSNAVRSWKILLPR